MFRLFRLLGWILFLFLFLWFATKVSLGKYTLIEHVKRIWSTKETQELVEGTKKTVKEEWKQIQPSEKDGDKDPENKTGKPPSKKTPTPN